MDVFRDIIDEITQWFMESSNKRFAVGCGCLLFVALVILAAVFAAGWWWGAG